MKEFWTQLSDGHKDALMFIFICVTIIASVSTAAIAIIITVSNYPT